MPTFPKWWTWELIDVSHHARSWLVIVEPDVEARLLVVDYNTAGRPVGVEITAPQAVSLERINELLTAIGQPPLDDHEFKPVKAA